MAHFEWTAFAWIPARTMIIDYQGPATQGLAMRIAADIRAAIVAGRLTVNERLPTEEELAARWRVSRPTIQEALKRLAAQNLIRSRRGPSGGTFVSQPSREEARLTVANVATLPVRRWATTCAT